MHGRQSMSLSRNSVQRAQSSDRHMLQGGSPEQKHDSAQSGVLLTIMIMSGHCFQEW